MTYYSVVIETRDNDGSPLTEDAFRAFAAAVQPFDGVTGFGDESWSARLSVEADSTAGAVALGAALVTSLAGQAGLPAWPVVCAEAVREDVLDEDLARPQLPELVSAAEAAVILGIPEQQMHKVAAGLPGFPAPAYRLRTGNLWLRPAIVGFAEGWDRGAEPPRVP